MEILDFLKLSNMLKMVMEILTDPLPLGIKHGWLKILKLPSTMMVKTFRWVADNRLKQKGTEHWISPNERATNEVGFTALRGNYRDQNGSFGEIGDFGFWWTNTEDKKNYNENGWL